MDLGIKGRTALITGGSKGIGFAIAEQLAEEGCNVILVARSADDLAAARDKLLKKWKVDVRVRPADLSNQAVIGELAAEFPDIDILVNNAGAIRTGRLDEVDDPTWRGYWELKVFGYISMTRAFYALMKPRGRGVILNIIGIAGERMRADYIAGSTGNAGLIAFTRAMGGESSKYGVRILGINPGPVLTEKLMMSLKKTAKDKFGDENRWQELTQSMPFGRTIRPVEIGAMAALLVSDLSGYTNGEVVNIVGGGMYRQS